MLPRGGTQQLAGEPELRIGSALAWLRSELVGPSVLSFSRRVCPGGQHMVHIVGGGEWVPPCPSHPAGLLPPGAPEQQAGSCSTGDGRMGNASPGEGLALPSSSPSWPGVQRGAF